jgi:hypothetical protein
MNNEWIEGGRGPISSTGIVRELLSSDQITIQSPSSACDGISAFQKVGTHIDARKKKTTQLQRVRFNYSIWRREHGHRTQVSITDMVYSPANKSIRSWVWLTFTISGAITSNCDREILDAVQQSAGL